MDTLQTMRVYARVAQRGSFAAAARDLRMSRASVTKHVSAIESRLGVRLLDRTTRSVHLTEAGRVYLERTLECLQAFADADAAIGHLSAEPRGVLRVGAPFDFNRHLPRLVTSFMKSYPSILLDVRLSNRTLDMVDEGIDVYLRITNTIDRDLVARKLAVTRQHLVGTRAYFERYGRPRTIGELSKHRFILFDEPPLLDTWTFERKGKATAVALKPAIVSNSGDVLVEAVCAGHALGALPSFLISPQMAGLLEPLLPEWSAGERGVYAVYPHRRFVPAKVRLFVDFLRAELGDPSADPFAPAFAAGRRALSR
jgi:DNA-binding transcriptional LysR family regulator